MVEQDTETLNVMIYAPSLHFKRILEHVLKKIAPTDSPVYTSEIESAIVKIYKEM